MSSEAVGAAGVSKGIIAPREVASNILGEIATVVAYIGITVGVIGTLLGGGSTLNMQLVGTCLFLGAIILGVSSFLLKKKKEAEAASSEAESKMRRVGQMFIKELVKILIFSGLTALIVAGHYCGGFHGATVARNVSIGGGLISSVTLLALAICGYKLLKKKPTETT